MQHHPSPAGRRLWFTTLAVSGLAFATLIARPLHPKTHVDPRPDTAAGDHLEVLMPRDDATRAMRAMLERRLRRHDARRFTA